MGIILRCLTVLSTLAFVAMAAEADCMHRKTVAEVMEPYRPYSMYSWNKPLLQSAMSRPLDESGIESVLKRLYAIPATETQIPVLMSLLLKKYREQPITEDMRKPLMLEVQAFNTRFEQLTAKAMKGDRAAAEQRVALFALYFLYTDICEEFYLRQRRERYGF